MRVYCAAVFQWEAGSGGVRLQASSMLSSACSWSGGHVGHLSLAIFIYDSDFTPRTEPIVEVNDHNIDDFIEDVIRNVVLQRTLHTANDHNNINGLFGIVRSRYLSFWGSADAFFGGPGTIHSEIAADIRNLENRMPIIKCTLISQDSYELLSFNMQVLENTPGDWRPTRNCATVVKELFAPAMTPQGTLVLRDPTVCESLFQCIDTPSAVFDRFSDRIQVEFREVIRNAVIPL